MSRWSTQLSLIDQWIGLFRTMRTELGRGDIEAACRASGDGLVIAGALFSALDPIRHPELTRTLRGVYELCLGSVAAARRGDAAGVDTAVAMLSALRTALRAVDAAAA